MALYLRLKPTKKNILIARLRANAGFLVLAVFFFLSAWVIDGWDFFTENKTSVSYKFKKALEYRDAQLNDIIKEADVHFDTYTYGSFVETYDQQFDNLYDDKQCGLFIFRNDSLVYWTDNSIPVEDNLYYSDYKNRIVKLKSGWYQSVYRQRDNITFVVLGLIKHSFPYQNTYLSNSFQRSFDIPDEVEINLPLPDARVPAVQQQQAYNYELVYPDEFKPAQTLRHISISFYCVSIILFLLFFERACRQTRRKRNAAIYAFGLMVLVVLLRYIGFITKFPDNLYNLELFSPLLYAESETLPSLGDLLLTALTAFYVVYLFSRYVTLTRFKEKIPGWLRFTIAVAVFEFIFLLAPYTFGMLKGLVINSNISFNINNLFSLTVYSYIAFFVFGIILLGLFVITDRLIALVAYYGNNLKFGLGAFALAIGINLLFFAGYDFDNMVYGAFIFLISGIIIGNKLQHRVRYAFTSALLLVLLFGLFSTYIISSNTIEKERLNRELMASRLAAENDPILEFLFTDVNNKIQKDSVLHSYLLPNSEAADKKQFKDLNQLYFNGYWEKYEIKVTVFGADNCPLRVLNTSTHHDPIYFENLIREHGRPTVSDNFFFLDNANGRISYLAKVKLSKRDAGVDYTGTLYIEFDSKYNLEEVGYPELLLDRKVKAEVDLTDYSYSRYKNGKLVGQYGKYPYSLTSSVFGTLGQEYNWVNNEGFTHLVDKTSDDTMVVLSRKKPGFLDVITPFSYFFFFYGLLALIYYIVATVSIRRQRAKFWLFGVIDFKGRIQLTVIVMLMVSLIIIGVGTIYYVINQSTYKNEELISEKIHSVSTELQNKIGGYDVIYPYMYDELSFSFSRMSNVFFSDINMYDLNGRLIASSRPVIFEEGLAGKNIDPYALRKLRMKQKTEFIHDENIGDLNYISAYVPFRNRDNKLLGYINLPYFAKQSELRKEITTVLVAIVNIYVLLIGISLIVAILISDRITRPLRLIQEKMGRLRLGKSYELIDYKANDEIGRLVAEYNRMIKELDVSAELLARSERESAWKEMAKQVAHEIKNPLTPMKLSVQQLQRTYKPNDPDWEAQLKRFTISLIEQIDTLSRIAGEFATFARMPKTHAEKVNLYEMLVNMQQLHANDTGATITFKPDTVPPCMVIADKEQLLRVFNNLIKNAIQAIPEDKEGLIVLGIKRTQTSFIASVSDNGNGIPEELHDKIFIPNFTTKTSGMGLGLAIVKSIVDSSGGTIWFETKEDEGSVFYVELPIAV